MSEKSKRLAWASAKPAQRSTAARGPRAFADVLRESADEPDLRKGERTKRLVRWAAACCLARASYAALSVEAIVDEAGVSRPAFYQYFRSKADVVRDVLERFQRFLPEIFVARASEVGVFDAIRANNRAYIDFVGLNAPLMDRYTELRAEMPELIAGRQRLNAVHASRIAAAVRRYGGDSPSPERLAIRIHALEFLVDDFLREVYVVGNPNVAKFAEKPDMLAHELSVIWFKTLFGSASPGARGDEAWAPRTALRESPRTAPARRSPRRT